MSGARGRPSALWGMALAVLLLTESTRAMAIEEPEYRVIQQDGPFELREYAPYMLAETAVDAGFLNAGNIAFGRLFRYISGANTTQAKIAMTAPVEQAQRPDVKASEKIAMTAPVEQSAVDGVYRIGFVVPREYSPATVPQPTDARVSIRAVPARRVAVWRYSGRWTEANFRENERRLRARLEKQRLEPVAGDSAIIARYNSPFAVWFLRRNEVLIPLQAPR